MRFIKWKFLCVTTIVCLLPIIFGLAVWNDLPDTIAIHFDINNNPDNYVSKGFAVFVIPLLMVILQWVCCLINDINAYKFGTRQKLECATKWIIPAMSFVLYVITLGYALGWNIDIRISVCFVLGTVLIVVGNYLPKMDRLKHVELDSETSRIINRFIGYETVIIGVLFYISAFLPPVTTIICVFMFIPYTIISIIYSIRVIKNKN